MRRRQKRRSKAHKEKRTARHQTVFIGKTIQMRDAIANIECNQVDVKARVTFDLSSTWRKGQMANCSLYIWSSEKQQSSAWISPGLEWNKMHKYTHTFCTHTLAHAKCQHICKCRSLAFYDYCPDGRHPPYDHVFENPRSRSNAYTHTRIVAI